MFPKIFCSLNFRLKTPNRSNCVSLHKYRKLPLESPGRIQLRKGVLGALIKGGAYIRGGGAYKRNKKTFRNESQQC